jgi:hypothetical protein
MVINWILDTSKTKATIENRSAVFFISLTEAGVLMKLCENFIQGGYWVIALQIL